MGGGDNTRKSSRKKKSEIPFSPSQPIDFSTYVEMSSQITSPKTPPPSSDAIHATSSPITEEDIYDLVSELPDTDE